MSTNAKNFLKSIETMEYDFNNRAVEHAIQAIVSSMQPQLQNLGKGEYARLLEKDWNEALIQQSGGSYLSDSGKTQILKIFEKYSSRCKKREEKLLRKLQKSIEVINELLEELDKRTPKKTPKRSPKKSPAKSLTRSRKSLNSPIKKSPSKIKARKLKFASPHNYNITPHPPVKPVRHYAKK